MAELRAPEVARDHATLDKQLKKIDKKYYTDEVLAVLTLNDKQHAVITATVPDEPAGDEEYSPGDTSGYILNPVVRDDEVVALLEPENVVTPGPVASAEEVEARGVVESSPVLEDVPLHEQAAEGEESEADEDSSDSEDEASEEVETSEDEE